MRKSSTFLIILRGSSTKAGQKRTATMKRKPALFCLSDGKKEAGGDKESIFWWFTSMLIKHELSGVQNKNMGLFFPLDSFSSYVASYKTY